jgi:hypothetical protein
MEILGKQSNCIEIRYQAGSTSIFFSRYDPNVKYSQETQFINTKFLQEHVTSTMRFNIIASLCTTIMLAIAAAAPASRMFPYRNTTSDYLI